MGASPVAPGWRFRRHSTRANGHRRTKRELPHAFSYWLFEALGLEPTDTFRDMYVGSGAVSAAWDQWRNQRLDVAPQLEMEATWIA
jgi:hypothetical protein